MGLDLDRKTVATQAAAFVTMGHDLAAALKPVLPTLADVTKDCGTDGIGRNFAALYQPHASKVLPAFTGVEKRLNTLGGLLDDMSHLLAGQDEAAAARFRKLDASIPTAKNPF